MDRATVPSSYDVRRCVRWFEARSSAIQRACHHKFGRSSPFSGSLSRWTFCNGNRIQLPRYRFSTSPQALHTLPVWLGQRQTSKTAPGAQINGHTIHLPPILAKKPDVTRHSSAVQAFRTGSSTGTGGDLSAVPVAHAECIPCEADIRREASRAVRQFFRIV